MTITADCRATVARFAHWDGVHWRAVCVGRDGAKRCGWKGEWQDARFRALVDARGHNREAEAHRSKERTA